MKKPQFTICPTNITSIHLFVFLASLYIAIRVKTEFRLGAMSACMDVNMMDLLPNPFCSFMSGHIESLFVKRRLSGSLLWFYCQVMSL